MFNFSYLQTTKFHRQHVSFMIMLTIIFPFLHVELEAGVVVVFEHESSPAVVGVTQPRGSSSSR